MHGEITFELSCATPELEVALCSNSPMTGRERRWSLGPLIELIAAAASEDTQSIPRLSVRVIALPVASRAAALRVTLRKATATFTLDYSEHAAAGVWQRCLEGVLHAPVEARPPSRTTSHQELALSAVERRSCGNYTLHPHVLDLALRAISPELNGDCEVASIATIAIFARGAIPAQLVLHNDADDRAGISVSVMDANSRIIAQLAGVNKLGTSPTSLITIEQLVELARDSLGKQISGDVHLLQAGVNSIDLVRLANAIFEHSGVAVPLAVILKNPTLERVLTWIQHTHGHSKRSWSERLGDMLASAAEHTPHEPEQLAPLTSLQRAVWLASCLPDAAQSYVESTAYRLQGRVDVAALQRAWLHVASTHESCRSSIVQRGGEVSQLTLPLERAALQLAELPPGAGTADSEIAHWLRTEASYPFEAGRPWLRAALLRVTEHDHVLAFIGHHALCDGQSLRERVIPALSRGYQHAQQGHALQDMSTRPVLQPRHLAQLERESDYVAEVARSHEFWRTTLADAPHAPELPQTSEPKTAALPAQAGATYRFRISPAHTQSLRDVAQREQRSLFVVALGVYRAALYRWAQLDDMVIGAPMAQAWSPHFQTAAGCFVDFVPLRLAADGGSTMRTLVESVQERVSSALAHEHAPYAHVASVATAATDWPRPGVNVGFCYESSCAPLSLCGLTVNRLDLASTTTKLDLFLRLEDAGDELVATLEYRAQQFAAGAIEQFAQRYTRLLASTQTHFTVALRELPWLSENERAQLLANARGPTQLGVQPVLEVLEAAIAAGPEQCAVSEGDRKLSYRQLDEAANALAQQLLDIPERSGAHTQARVALYFDTGTAFPIGVLACLRAGVCFVPIDPQQPTLRVRSLLDGAQLDHVVTLRQHAHDPALAGRTVIVLEQLTPSTKRVTKPMGEEALAYGIYTSGSTGAPKLALATRAGISNKVFAQREAFALPRGTRVLQFASPAFDAAFSEAVLALAAGATLVTAELRARYDGESLRSLMRTERVQVAMLTPSVVSGLADAVLPDLNLLLVVGERCPKELVEQWAVGRRMFNLYGPAETSVWATGERCQPEAGAPGIGRPITNVSTYILDRDLNLLPAGQTGEICIGGAAVGPGYLNAPELTNTRFVADPHAADGGGRLYRTGDRGRCLPDGRIVFMGRNDEQIKLRGRRVELGEIEAALCEQPGIREAVAVVHAAGTPAARIIAYVTQPHDESAVRAAVRARLPSHAVPSRIITLSAWPRLPSGKVDRRALAAKPLDCDARTQATPRTATERAVADAMALALGRQHEPVAIGLDGDFFALGGHSLSAVALADALVKTTGVTIPLSKLLASPTVREIAARIDRALYDPNAASQASSAEVATLTRDCQLPPPPSLVPQARARERWQTVLLTGVTGGLGRELLAALLQETHAQIVCLVRANTAAEARERLSRTLASMPRSGAHDRSRVRAVCAHLDRPRLGLSDANYAWLGTEVDAIIHAAAAVDFSLPYARLRTVNVEGTRALIELAFERRRKEFHYVSSLSALFPRTDTQGGILEEVAGPAPELLTMSYGQTKAVSERLLASAADLGLPVRIYRPSRICPSAHDPDADTLLGRFLRACIQLERFPSLPGDDNLIPASTAARLIVGVARKRDLPQRYFHIANPVSTPMSVFTSALQTCGYRLRPISFTAFCEQLHNTQLAPLADFFRRDSLLEFGLPRVSIDNTRSALGATALDCPRVDVDWAIQNLTGLLHPRTAERAA